MTSDCSSKENNEIGYRVVIGGGLGRTPLIGKVVRDFLPKKDLLAYLEAPAYLQ